MENKENDNKYKAQIKHLRSSYKRITIDILLNDIDKEEIYCQYLGRYY